MGRLPPGGHEVTDDLLGRLEAALASPALTLSVGGGGLPGEFQRLTFDRTVLVDREDLRQVVALLQGLGVGPDHVVGP